MNTLTIRDKNNKFGTIYYGIVKDNEDPTKQGRIKVQLSEIYGDTDPSQTPWIYPLGYNSGVKLFNVPDKDTEVGIIFIGDFYTGFYGLGKFSKGVAKIFDEDYPNLYGFEDLQGNYLTINKSTGEIKFHHISGLEFSLDKDNNLKFYHPSNTTLNIDKDGNVSGTIEKTLNASVKEQANIDCPTINAKGNVTVDGNFVVTGTSNLKGTCTFENIGWKPHVHHSGDKTTGSVVG